MAGVLVKPEVARAQMEAEKPVPSAAASVPATQGTEPAAAGPAAAEPAADGKPTRFYGSVQLDPLRMGRDAGEVAEAVVQHLASLLGAGVEVRLEIQATLPDGAPDDVVRAVSENARTLKFEQHGFERD